MSQPLFSCSKCFKSFPQSEMSRSGQACKTCNPHHSTFKQCEFCKSDFKYYIYGTICPRCQSLKSKYGEPLPCSICNLQNAFGNALICLRCLHYRNRFGEPRECQSCSQMSAFLKDEVSRLKVDGQTLCWLCTYNFKLARSRERSDHGSSKRRHDTGGGGGVSVVDSTTRLKSDSGNLSKRSRPAEYGSRKSDLLSAGVQQTASTQAQSMDSIYNEHLLTIGQLQDEVKALKRQLGQKDAELFAKDRVIADLKSELIEQKSISDDRLRKSKADAQLDQERLSSTIRQLQREKVSLSQGLKRRKSGTNLSAMSALRSSSSSVALFNPDSPITISFADKTPKLKSSGTIKPSTSAIFDDNEARGTTPTKELPVSDPVKDEVVEVSDNVVNTANGCSSEVIVKVDAFSDGDLSPEKVNVDELQKPSESANPDRKASPELTSSDSSEQSEDEETAPSDRWTTTPSKNPLDSLSDSETSDI